MTYAIELNKYTPEEYLKYKSEWVNKAYTECIEALAFMKSEFTIEELRWMADLAEAPLDGRWWGEVTTKLKKNGYIKRKASEGKATVSSNNSLKPLWVKSNQVVDATPELFLDKNLIYPEPKQSLFKRFKNFWKSAPLGTNFFSR